MDGNDGTRSRCDGAFDLRGIEIGRGGVDVHEHWPRAAVGDCLGGGEKCIRTGDDFVARLNAEGEQAEVKSCRAGTEGHAVLHVAVGRKLAFELLYILAQHKRRVFADAIERRKNLVAQFVVFGFQIEKRNLHR